jgi:PIN domain nuclease of toxin-antitoxin system
VSKFVLDASALLALLNDEPGAERLPAESELMSSAVMSTVNLAEAQGKLVSSGIPPKQAWEALLAPLGEVSDFSHEHAKRAGTLLPQTRALGLSLGGRACLSLALALGVPVYTADRQWAKLDLGIPIHVIR